MYWLSIKVNEKNVMWKVPCFCISFPNGATFIATQSYNVPCIGQKDCVYFFDEKNANIQLEFVKNTSHIAYFRPYLKLPHHIHREYHSML
jgi:hypothetical protein